MAQTTINGTTYSSVKAAAKAHNVSYTAVKQRYARGIRGEALVAPVADKTIHPGTVYDRLTTVKILRRDADRNIVWLCQCACGNAHEIAATQLHKGTQSCGCLQREVARDTQLKHGMESSREYNVWLNMRRRCTDPSNTRYNRYGGRGIKVCKRWSEFAQFYEDMGPCPEGMSLDRKNNDGDYKPSNCRWATGVEQANNRSNNIRTTIEGESLTLAQAARKYDVNKNTIYSRYRRGLRGQALVHHGGGR